MAPDSSAPEGSLHLHDERLPSHIPSVFFTVRIDGAWHLRKDDPPQHHDPAALARHHLREHARHTLARYSVLEKPAAQDAVNVAVDRSLKAAPGLTTQGTAHLTVAEADLEMAEAHLRNERRGELDQQETRRRLIFLQRILSDPDLRRVWWIDQYPDRLAELGQMTDEVKDLRPPHDFSRTSLRNEIVRFVDQLLTDIRTPQQREVFLRALTQTLHTLGSTELQHMATHWLSSSPTDRTEPEGDTI